MVCKLQQKLQIIALTLESKAKVKYTKNLFFACSTNFSCILADVLHILYNDCQYDI